MKLLEFKWSEEKNAILKRERGLSFEEVVLAYQDDRLLDDLDHPDPNRPHQRLMVVEIERNVCVVPYVREGRTGFLKTIYRSRDMERKYRGTK